jgi:hypothetical protein
LSAGQRAIGGISGRSFYWSSVMVQDVERQPHCLEAGADGWDLCRKHGVVMLPLFEVVDIDQARAALTGGGAAELLGAVESDAAWRWFLARGPSGNLYSFGARRR